MFESPTRILLHRDRIEKIISNKIVQPATIDIELSWSCNHACEWCAYDEYHKKSYLSAEKIREIISYCKENNINWVILSGGGEPTLNPDFKEIIYILESEKINYALFTNGSMLEKYSDIFGMYCRYLRVSLDSGTSNTYSKVHRVPESEFLRILNSLMTIKKRLINCYYGLSYVITENNYDEIPKFVDLANNLEVNEILIRKDLRYPDKKYPVNWDLIRKYPKLSIDWRDSEEHINYSPICYGSKLKLVIDADGNIPVCLRHRELIAGNIYENNIKEIWNSLNYNNLIDEVDAKQCLPCRFTECNNLIHSHIYCNKLIDIV